MRARGILLIALAVAAFALAGALAQRRRFAREPFAPGDRVRVLASSPRAAGATGTVGLPPLPVTGDEAGWEGHVRRHGGEPAFWVTLDAPLARPDAPALRGLELPASALARVRAGVRAGVRAHRE